MEDLIKCLCQLILILMNLQLTDFGNLDDPLNQKSLYLIFLVNYYF